MSNLVPSNIQIPAHVARRMGQPSALAAKIMGGLTSGESVPRISIKGSRFRIVEGGNETVLDTTTLNVVIVGANPNLSKTYYAKAWDGSAEPTAPDCYSLGGITPAPDSTSPQNDLCASCPHNAWGSKKGPQGQDLKACSDTKRLAVVAAEDPTGPIYLLTVTAAALKGLNAYQKELTMRGMATEIVVTKVSFDTSASFPKLMFSFGGFLDDETMATLDDVANSPSVLDITGESAAGIPAVPQMQKTLAKPSVKAAPLPAPAPVVVEEVEEEAPAPKRGFGAKAAAPAPAPAAAPKAAAPKAAPKPAPVESTSSIADDIANLLSEVDADDA